MPGMAGPTGGPVWPWLGLALTAAGGYLAAAAAIRSRGGRWPYHRDVFWCAGVAAAVAAVCGPVAAHHDFRAHMIGHLLLGMAVPLLLVLTAPITLLLRVLPVGRAGGVSRLLRTGPLRTLTHPVLAAVLAAGGQWLLYTTSLYPRMAESGWLHLLVHAHLFAAGYVFTAAIVGIDPMPHRPGRGTRAVVLLVFLAAHGVLAKYLYAHPPAGVPGVQVRAGSEVMYYGGDLVDLGLLVVFCRQWYTAAAPARRARQPRAGVRRARRPWRLPADI
jgi:putative membrane protein